MPRQGDGLHPDEVRRRVRVGEVQLPVRWQRAAAWARAFADTTDGRWLVDASEQEELDNHRHRDMYCLVPLLMFHVVLAWTQK